jgi:hypothetical protein
MRPAVKLRNDRRKAPQTTEISYVVNNEQTNAGDVRAILTQPIITQ